jgi:hypothetical protein
MDERVQGEASDEPEATTRGVRGIWGRFSLFIIPVAGLFLTLGEASDATFLLQDMGRSVVELFSNRVEYGTLERIHVGNSTSYVESILGDPQVVRSIDDGVTAKYFHSSKYLLTLFDRDGRVEAFTVLALQDGFSPKVELGGLGSSELGAFAFSDAPAPAHEMAVDHSRTSDYYLESLDSGPSGRFVNIYLGSVGFGSGGASPRIGDLYSALLEDDQSAVAVAQSNLREQGTPNFYGEGELSLESVEASLFTNAEFSNFFEIE